MAHRSRLAAGTGVEPWWPDKQYPRAVVRMNAGVKFITNTEPDCAEPNAKPRPDKQGPGGWANRCRRILDPPDEPSTTANKRSCRVNLDPPMA